ncbi:unnamed protein product [Protopolystoma xenopodis]|uniref:Uncharacterized protein n=1 Tax=Protopolystoma xenopodis TaxID=117903 RepID=A0A448WJ98_9PLAT|nr:unnamed protein product [Protopolystoma xenopodis]
MGLSTDVKGVQTLGLYSLGQTCWRYAVSSLNDVEYGRFDMFAVLVDRTYGMPSPAFPSSKGNSSLYLNIKQIINPHLHF